MSTRKIGNIRLIYSSKETETADLIADTCEKAIQLAGEDWGLKPPQNCRIYVMTSWFGFVFHSAPWSWKAMLALTVPLWFSRIRRSWQYSAAWTQRYGSRIAIGVKPARLIELSDKSIGIHIFVEEKDNAVKVRDITCHELVHACSAHLFLPMWLNEGIATVTTERFLEKPTIREDSLQFMKDYLPKAAPPAYGELSRMDMEAIAYHSVRGYWLVRYFEEKCPGLLRSMFSQRTSEEKIERNIATELGIKQENFWNEIDGIIADYFINTKSQ